MKHDNGTFTLRKEECTALLAYCSDDDSRAHLCRVQFSPRQGAVYATDGYTLVRAQNCARHDAESFGVARDNLDYATRMLRRKDQVLTVARRGERVLLEVRSGEVSAALVEADVPNDTFPPAEQVIPHYTNEEAVAVFGVDAIYLARLQLVGRAAGNTHMRFHHQGPLDPVVSVVENVHEGVTWTVVTMPVRL